MKGNSTPMMQLWTMANVRLLAVTLPSFLGLVLFVRNLKEVPNIGIISLVFLVFGIWTSLHVDPVFKILRSLARTEYRCTLSTADLQAIDWNSKLVRFIVGERAARHWGRIAAGDSSKS